MKRFLVVTPNWFGDTLFATPVLRALRERFPKAYIATLSVPRCQELLQGNPHLNELVIYEEDARHKGVTGKLKMIAELKRHHFDTAFILRKSLTRSLLLLIAGIPRRIGYANRKSNLFLSHRIPQPPTMLHRVDYFTDLLEGVGIKVAEHRYEFFIADKDRQTVKRWLKAQQVPHHQRVVILNAGGNWPHKRWPAERFAQLADHLQSNGARIIFGGGPQDVELVRGITAQMNTQPLIATGEFSLKQLGALCERAQVMVSNDSGPMHIASSMGTTVVALFGPTDPAITGPRGQGRAIVIRKPGCCPQIPCYSPDAPPHPGMRAIAVEEVAQAVEDCLDAQPTSA